MDETLLAVAVKPRPAGVDPLAPYAVAAAFFVESVGPLGLRYLSATFCWPGLLPVAALAFEFWSVLDVRLLMAALVPVPMPEGDALRLAMGDTFNSSSVFFDVDWESEDVPLYPVEVYCVADVYTPLRMWVVVVVVVVVVWPSFPVVICELPVFVVETDEDATFASLSCTSGSSWQISNWI